MTEDRLIRKLGKGYCDTERRHAAAKAISSNVVEISK